MPPRTPPTFEQLAAALDNLLHRTPDLPDRPRALDWNSATDTLRRRLQTNRNKAGDWLYEAAGHDDCPITVIRATGYHVRITRWSPEEEKVVEIEIDWPRIVQSHTAFSRTGVLLAADQIKTAAPWSQTSLWVVRRSELRVMRRLIEADTVEMEQQQAAERAATQTEFDRLHGDDLTVIRALIDRIAPPDWLTSDVLYTSVTSSPKAAELYGTGGSLTISLRGNHITKFADELRKLEHPE